MSRWATQAAEGTHVVLYDGVCGLCNGLVRFLLRHDRRSVFALAPLQSRFGTAIVERFGGRPGELTSFYVVAYYRTDRARMFSRSDAALFVAGALGWPRKAALVMRAIPAGVRDHGYDAIARTRYRLFGHFDHCVVPRPELRHRFIDI